MPWPPPRPSTWVIDLDGVVWRAGQPIDGAVSALARLQAAGNRTVFVTNNATPTLQDFLERLDKAGISAGPDDVIGSAQAMAAMIQPGSRALVVGEDGVLEALDQRQVQVVDHGPVDAVIVSRTALFDYEALHRASHAVRSGARLIGTSDDATHPTPEGLVPGTGSLLAAVATAAGVDPEVAGKPHPPMVRLVQERVGEVSVVVGDRPSTDGRLAEFLGARYALVLSGVTPSGEGVTPVPDVVAHDLAALARATTER